MNMRYFHAKEMFKKIFSFFQIYLQVLKKFAKLVWIEIFTSFYSRWPDSEIADLKVHFTA